MKAGSVWGVACVAVFGAALAVAGWYMSVRSVVPPLPKQTEGDGKDEIYFRALTTSPAISKEELQHLLDGDCRLVHAGIDFPMPVRNAFATLTRERTFALADPGERFNSTDVIEEGLARRRLVFGGVCGRRWFIHYERGGIGLSNLVVVMDLRTNDTMTVAWGGWLTKRANDLDDLRLMIANKESDEPERVYW